MVHEIRTRWRIFIYNLIKRHWYDLKLKRRWVAGGLDPADFQKPGKLTRDEYEFVGQALQAALEHTKERNKRRREVTAKLKGRHE